MIKHDYGKGSKDLQAESKGRKDLFYVNVTSSSRRFKVAEISLLNAMGYVATIPIITI